MSRKQIKIKWGKFENASEPTFIGNQIFAFSCDDTIIFKNFKTSERKFYQASGDEFGDGVSCITGHSFYNIFAFAEATLIPKIFVLTYPDFEQVRVLKNKNTLGKYTQIQFSQMDYLVALTGFPYYKLKIWNYRSGHLLMDDNTEITSEYQQMKISISMPFMILYYLPRQRLLVTNEVLIIGEKAFIIKRRVPVKFETPHYYPCMITAADGSIYYTDDYGCLYNVILSTRTTKVLWKWNTNEPTKTLFTPFKNGFFISVKDQLKFIRSKHGNYSAVFSMVADAPIVYLSTTPNQDTLCYLDKYAILTITEDTPSGRLFKVIGDTARTVKFFDFIYPQGEYLAVLSRFDELCTVDLETGNKISIFFLIEDVTAMISHPNYPLIITGDNKSRLRFVTFYNPQMPRILTKFLLGGSAIKFLKFSPSGKYLIVVDSQFEFYIVKGVLDEISCIAHFRCEYFLFDYTTYETADYINLVLLISQNLKSKDILSKYCLFVQIHKKEYKIEKELIHLPHTYIHLAPICTQREINTQFLAIPFNDYHFHILEIKDNKAKIVSTFKTVHQVKYFNMFTDYLNITTFSIDGIVSVFDLSTKSLEFNYAGCNRMAGRLVKACCSPNKRYCLALTDSGCLKCVEIEPFNNQYSVSLPPQIDNNIIVHYDYLDKYKGEQQRILKELRDKNMLDEQLEKAKSLAMWDDAFGIDQDSNVSDISLTTNFSRIDKSLGKLDKDSIESNEVSTYSDKEDNVQVEKASHENIPWLIIDREKAARIQTEQYKDMKQKIIADFKALKQKVVDLLNKNDIAEDIDKLKTYQFNLNTDWENHVKLIARLEREREQNLLQEYIEDQNRITQWIIENTWNQMAVKSRQILAISSHASCENYGLTLEEKSNEQQMKRVQLLRNSEFFTEPGDSFHPWKPKWSASFILSTEKPKYLKDQVATLYNETSDSNDFYKIRKYALSGTNTHEFIEPSIYQYEQFDVVSFQQMFTQQIICKNDIMRLKEFFNKEFQSLAKLKEDRMNFVKEKNDRLRYIQKEFLLLSIMLGYINVPEDQVIQDPEYTSAENPETIIKVEDDELEVKPYISPSKQKILDALAYQEEQRRLALLADDFRERALMAMMDGLLERRWEDEIKFDPEPPQCVKDNKDPYEYTKEDIKEQQEYQERLKHLRTEREKYRIMLLEERDKINSQKIEQIDKFNLVCGKTFSRKLQIDASIQHEEIKVLLTTMYNRGRKDYIKQKFQIVADKEKLKEKTGILSQIIEENEKSVEEIRTKYEQIQAHDRLLDKQFKAQFLEMHPNLNPEIMQKIFRKRPKWPQRAWATQAILNEMITRMIHRNNSRTGIPLPEECYEYLQMVDENENFILAPKNMLDQHIWNKIMRMRRTKIESEFKLKACGAQLAEAEASLNALTKELQNRKNFSIALDEKLRDIKKAYYEFIQNKQIQLVLPMGLVEIPLTGKLSDFDGCILLKSSDINEINKIIKNAGQKKLSALNKLAHFRRNVRMKEWQHKFFQMTIQDIEHLLSMVEKYPITVEVLDYIRLKQAGRIEDLSNNALNREIEIKMNKFQEQLNAMDERIQEALKKIADQKKMNDELDKKIQSINLEITEQTLQRDIFLEEKELRERKERMDIVVERSKLVRKVQANHAKILELVTILELQKLRTYPTLAPVKNVCQ